LRIPADPSSAAPLAAAAALLPGSHVCFEDLGLNPHRVAFFEVLREMGAQVEISALASEAGEPLGAVEVKAGSLRGVSVQSHQVAGLIDELPLLAVLGCFAEGTTQVRGAAELRRKESDRIRAMTRGLRALGAEIDELEDGFVVSGPQELRPGRIETDQDHRIAMAFLVAGLRVPVELSESASLNVSYPQFCEDLRRLTRG
jgi:3-phosphoshikimate 1-carboxyvinyltransferase